MQGGGGNHHWVRPPSVRAVVALQPFTLMSSSELNVIVDSRGSVASNSQEPCCLDRPPTCTARVWLCALRSLQQQRITGCLSVWAATLVPHSSLLIFLPLSVGFSLCAKPVYSTVVCPLCLQEPPAEGFGSAHIQPHGPSSLQDARSASPHESTGASQVVGRPLTRDLLLGAIAKVTSLTLPHPSA
jgi:hypothetical protein